MITLERLREVLEYDPESGVWVWIARTGKKSKPGKIAGSVESHGYVVIRIDKGLYKAHRLAWLYMTGEWPKATIDHKNLERADNRWVNLREATQSQNNTNRGLTGLNKSGFKGVSWEKLAGKWRAQGRAGRQAMYIGLYETKEEASAAYEAWAMEAHGEFYRER